MKIISIILIFLLGILVSYSLIILQKNDIESKNFQEKRNDVLSKIDLTLKEATESGKYKCCIEPPCDMCFLGHWIWDNGICECDEMMKQDKWDQVCPQCVRGIEEGRCKSTQSPDSSCSILNEGNQNGRN